MWNKEYHYREIGAETEERFMYILQRKLAEIEPIYNRMFRLYEENNIDQLYRETIATGTNDRHITDTSNQNGTANSKFQDTPVTPLTTGDYATNKNESTTHDDKTNVQVGNITDVSTVKHNDESTLEQVNKNIRHWNNIVLMFCREFENCFINEIAKV